MKQRKTVSPAVVEWQSVVDAVGSSVGRSVINAVAGQELVHTVPHGEWRMHHMNVSLYDYRDPQFPLTNMMSIFPHEDPTVLPATVPGDPPWASAGDVNLVFSKMHLFFDVKEQIGQAQVLLSRPFVRLASKRRDGSGRLTYEILLDAHGHATPMPVSALTVAAPPGAYSMIARANIGGSNVLFGEGTITFGELVQTPVGDDPVVLTPAGSPGLRVELSYPNGGVTQAGYSTVVETPLGPEPPEQFQLSCGSGEPGENEPAPPGGEMGCTKSYYDINTTATAGGATTKICIRRMFDDAENGLIDQLALFRYEPNRTDCDQGMDTDPETPGCWVDKTTEVVDCTDDSVNRCNCPPDDAPGDEVVECGANPSDGKHVFLICGEFGGDDLVARSTASGAAPGLVAVVENARFRFSNEVNGTTYSGPDGPPALQQWRAPRTGTYRITATGARGGNATNSPNVTGGCGAQISGEVSLQAGQLIEMLVGQAGSTTTQSGGGGGGTFVLGPSGKLVIAGGGGGIRAGATVNGRAGGTGENGVAGSTSSSYSSATVAGGTGGGGGARAAGLGSGGGGWSGNGVSDGNNGQGGQSFLSASNGGRGGSALGCSVAAHGGYGGGGAGNGCYGGGGGGGYSGGGAGRVAGGGGSYNAGANPRAVSGMCTETGHGEVVIERVR